MYRQGAKAVLMKLHDEGCLSLVKGDKKNPSKVYTDAIYDLVMNDEKALFDWIAGLPIRFYDHETDKKGIVTKVKARIE